MDDEIWTTKDGRKIAVGDMDEQHVRNALRMVIRKRRESMAKLQQSPGFGLIVRLLKIELARDASRLAEDEQKLYDDLMNDVYEDKKWGSD